MSTEDTPENNGDTDVRIEEEVVQQDISMDIETEEEASQVPEEVLPPENSSDEATEKSRIQKEAFLEMFRIAPRIKDVLPDLKAFMDHPDVIEWDRREVEHLVELRIQEEKAKKKAEKAAAKLAQEQATKNPVDLAGLIKSATGINVAGILQNLSASQPAPIPVAVAPEASVAAPIPAIPKGAVVVHGQPEGLPPRTCATSDPIIVTRLAPPQPKVVSVGHGKCGFDTPHPNEIPEELRHAKPDMIAPIPDELRVLPARGPQIPPIPNELLPLEQRVFESLPLIFVRPPMRKTLFLAGARFGKRSERMKEQKMKEEGKNKKNKKRKAEESLDSSDGKKGRGGGFQKGGHRPFMSGMNALPAGLNKNSPLAVKRYHARQLAKETGISLEDAMKEIEEQCAEFGGEDTPEAREHDERAMEFIKRRGEEKWNQRYNYTPADHSKGIPGVDRPPAGRKSPPRKESYAREEPIPGVDKPPGAYSRDESIPGVDRPPGGYSRKESVPGVDRPPGGYSRDGPVPGVDRPPGGYSRNESIPGVDRPPGGHSRDGPIPGVDRPPGGDPWKRRSRGGVKERERKKRREEQMQGGGGRGRGRGGGGRGGYGGYDNRGGGYGGGSGHGRYNNSYDDFLSRDQNRYGGGSYGGGHEGYDDRRGYDEYYGGQEGGYENYDQYGGYGAQQSGDGAANYEYDQHSAENYYQQAHGGQDSTYYQEDGSQYYNEYYGTSTQDGAPGNEYQATFDTPAPPSSNPPPA